ncbi:peptidoglycan binding protein CsiV [Gammaproteobacteria bacterium]|nr:peptidoglycan binding protein CsiV [Gammaproteobacteria bacterium]
MNSFRLIATLFIFSLSTFAYSENNNEYMIEVIVFEQLEVIGNEKLEPKNLNLHNLDTIALLDKPAIIVNEEIISQSFNYEDAGFFEDQLNIEQIIDKQKKEASDPPPSLKKIDETKWFEKQQDLNQLNNIYRRLDRRKEYRILHKVSWLQPALSEDNSPFVHEIFGNNGFLIKLYQSRYLHLDVIAYLDGNLRPENNQELIKEIRFDALKSSIPDSVINHEIEIGSEIINSDKIFKTEPKIAQTRTNSSKVIEAGEVKYLLNEERRIFKNESHYFDHPKIGVIISVYDSSL